MPILALALYGSRARDDQQPDSDVDLFAVTDDAEYRMVVQANINMACYPRDLAIQRANSGDLFILHIALESRPLFDSSGEFDFIRESFNYKNSYEQEIDLASDLAWFLLKNAEKFRDYIFFNRRVAWCVRTILIARSAELRRPVFSAKQLGEFSGSSEAFLLISAKNSDQFISGYLDHLRGFLDRFGSPNPVPSGEQIDWAMRFSASRNVMGLKTLSNMRGSSSGDEY
ncbi:nucleotidyltransferase domain-containing protein [Trinickia dabaoshanensis]|uniref:Nucleotidyltransferase domain-containing protein n=1 Tax=Trinickia dabaoshanensis TaxID=564714 RepID=A0A2N7VPR4_9BURK|nr:nucleotidyltransferase domain-containing protein [Trinickia dabaoshanensis]PMS19151.1 nucleotidyltransferase domain-containing protein [Trinickia dabaoshanensis]